MIRFSEAAWTTILAADTAAGRAQALATLNPTTIEFLDAAAAVIRTVTTGAWTVSGANAVPGTYTDAGTGSGTPATAVFKASATEVMRMSCGTLAGSDYLLLANIVAGVPIRRGSFALTFLDPPLLGDVFPTNTKAPVISGTAAASGTLIANPGTWTGSLAPDVTYQWRRDGVAVAGQTGLTYEKSSADVGAMIDFRELATNAAGSAVALSNAIGPITVPVLDAETTPAPIVLYRGVPFDLADHIVGGVPPYTVAVASGYSLPANVTLVGTELLASGAATVTVSDDIVFDIDDSAPALVDLGLTSNVGGADLPFTVAQGFPEGAVQAGADVLADGLATFQSVPINHWPDGSVRLAWLSGRATLSAGVKRDLSLSSGLSAGGAAQSLTTLRSTLLSGSIQVGALETVDLPTLIAGAPFDIFGDGTATIFEGPECSYWIWRKRIAGTNFLELFVPIRLYAGGAVEVVTPWLQNGDFLVPSPVNVSATVTITLNGTQRFSETVSFNTHTAIPLVTGTARSYWYGTDPQIRPTHDVGYLEDAKLLPNFRSTLAPTETTLNGLTQSYSPGSILGFSPNMGASGAADGIGVITRQQALYVTSGADSRAYDSVIAYGLSAGSWPSHFRDSGGYGENTGRYFRQSAYPNASLASQFTPFVPEGQSHPDFKYVDAAHQPSLAFLPWILTGDIFFHEELVAWHTFNYLNNNYGYRRQTEGIFVLAYDVRGSAWQIRSMAHLLAGVSERHEQLASWRAQAQFNVARYHDRYVSGTDQGAAYQNSLGLIAVVSGTSVYNDGTNDGTSSPTGWYYAPWQNAMFVLAMRTLRDLQVGMDATHRTKLSALITWLHGASVAVAGTLATGWPYVRFGQYTMPYASCIGTGPSRTWGTWYSTWAEVYASWRSGWGLPIDSDTAGLPILNGNTSTPVSSDGWADIHWRSIPLAALALAYEDGATGAADAWGRIVGAPNFTISGMHDDPVWAFYPRGVA